MEKHMQDVMQNIELITDGVAGAGKCPREGVNQKITWCKQRFFTCLLYLSHSHLDLCPHDFSCLNLSMHYAEDDGCKCANDLYD